MGRLYPRTEQTAQQLALIHTDSWWSHPVSDDTQVSSYPLQASSGRRGGTSQTVSTRKTALSPALLSSMERAAKGVWAGPASSFVLAGSTGVGEGRTHALQEACWPQSSISVCSPDYIIEGKIRNFSVWNSTQQSDPIVQDVQRKVSVDELDPLMLSSDATSPSSSVLEAVLDTCTLSSVPFKWETLSCQLAPKSCTLLPLWHLLQPSWLLYPHCNCLSSDFH